MKFFIIGMCVTYVIIMFIYLYASAYSDDAGAIMDSVLLWWLMLIAMIPKRDNPLPLIAKARAKSAFQYKLKLDKKGIRYKQISKKWFIVYFPEQLNEFAESGDEHTLKTIYHRRYRYISKKPPVDYEIN